MNYPPDLKLLRTFVAVAEIGSMTQAATALGYVPSAVSQQVAALERSLGVELLIRKPGSRIAVTAAGRSLVSAAKPLFEAAATFSDLVETLAASGLPDLHLGAYPTAMRHLLPSVLADLDGTPGAPIVHLKEMETPQALPLLRSGELDVLLAYRYLKDAPPRPAEEWTITPLGPEPMVVVASTLPGAPRTLSDCAGHDWIIGYPHNDDSQLLRRWARGVGLTTRVRHETTDPHSALAVVAAGLAVSLIPATVFLDGRDSGASVAAVPLPAGAQAPYREVLSVTRAKFRPPFVELLIAEVRRALAARVAPLTRPPASPRNP